MKHTSPSPASPLCSTTTKVSYPFCFHLTALSILSICCLARSFVRSPLRCHSICQSNKKKIIKKKTIASPKLPLPVFCDVTPNYHRDRLKLCNCVCFIRNRVFFSLFPSLFSLLLFALLFHTRSHTITHVLCPYFCPAWITMCVCLTRHVCIPPTATIWKQLMKTKQNCHVFVTLPTWKQQNKNKTPRDCVMPLINFVPFCKPRFFSNCICYSSFFLFSCSTFLIALQTLALSRSFYLFVCYVFSFFLDCAKWNVLHHHLAIF